MKFNWLRDWIHRLLRFLQQLVRYPAKILKKKEKEIDYKYFGAISDLLYFSIRKQNEKIAHTISNFMYRAFKAIRDKHTNEEVIYPTVYYEMVSKTIEELAIQNNRRLKFLEHRTAGSVWLLGEFGNSKISETTYSWVWRNLTISLQYDRDDYIIYHWEQAFQYIKMSLEHINPEYSREPPFEIINKEVIAERNKERKRFLEFHYVLGGLLLYKKKYDCLKRAFFYTQSTPPQYELLPETMNEVFNWYFDFRDPYEMRHPWISSKYYFPEVGGMDSSDVIKKWVCEYIALLFIRQYSIVPHLIYMEPLNPPAIPNSQEEKHLWKNNLDYFKALVKDVLRNTALLKTVGLDFVTDNWCEDHKAPKPLDFIDKVKKDVIASFEGTLVEQPVSESKVQKFKETSIGIIFPVVNEYNVINNETELTGEIKRWYINGLSYVIDKSAFADNQEATHLNYDSFLAENFINKYRDAMSEIFTLATTVSYLLNPQDIIEGIKRLNINIADYVIVSFGIDLKSLAESSNDDFLDGFKTESFLYRNYHIVGNSLFILKKSDLPKLNYRDIKHEEIEKYSWAKLIDQYNIYVTVVDLNQSEGLRETLTESSKDKDLVKSVFVGISMDLEVQWKMGITCIQIKEASPYRQSGVINNLSDVKPLIGESSETNS